MLVVITLTVPLTVPKLFGYQIYAVLTESMTPAYSVGSVIYVRTCEGSEIEVGDAITFRMGTNTEHVMTHRVVEIDEEAQLFVTKGDANDAVDSEPVAFKRLIGKVVLSIPGLAGVSDYINTTNGKAVIFILFCFSFLLWVAGDILNPKKSGEAATDARERKLNLQIILQLAGIILIVGALIYLGGTIGEYYRGVSEYDALRELILTTEDGSEMKPQSSGNSAKNDNGSATAADPQTDTEGLDAAEIERYHQQMQDAMKQLQQENGDVAGWIEFDNMELSYPVMYCGDNDYYLKRTYSGKSNSAGSIFIEAANSPDFEDCHTIIYGHNMRNLSMFGKLKYYVEEDFYKEHQYFTIYTGENSYRYQIFACYETSEVGEVYTVGFGPDAVFQEFLNEMKRRAYYDTGVSVNAQDKVITLSTCSTEGNRFVVNAKRIEE